MEKKEENFEINKVNDLAEKLKEAVENSTNKPTEEEIAEGKLKFEEASSLFATKSWDIGEAKDSRTFVDYLLHFTRNRLFWTKNGWMGVIKMEEELEDSSKFIRIHKDSPLKLGYQAMEFIFYSLQNPGGVGIQAAKDFESENNVFVPIFDALAKCISEARSELKHIQFLQDQYTAMQQGFYLEIEPPAEEEVVLPEENIVINEVVTKDTE